MTATIHDLYDLTIAARLEPDVMAQALARTWSYVRDEHPWAGDGAAVAWYRFSADRIRLRTRVWTINDLTPVGCTRGPCGAGQSVGPSANSRTSCSRRTNGKRSSAARRATKPER